MRKNMKGKRENNDNGGGPDNKRNRRDGQDDKNAVRLLIPSTIAGAVIGKGGQHIQRMRTQYKATVSVDDSQGPERTILIATELDSTMQIITEMLKYFEELPDEEYDVRLLIHQSLAGCVIGKGGQKIKEIRDKIGCRILKVFSNVAPQSTDRVVQTVGKQDQVLNAVREVITLTRETPIKGAVHYYEPRNFNRMFSDEYGGYGNIMPNNQRAPRGNNRGNFGGGGGNGGGRNAGSNDRNRNDRSRSNGRRENPFVNPWANNNNNSGGFGANNNGGGGGGGGGGFPGNFGGGFAPNFGGGNAFGNMAGGNNFSNPPGFNQGGFGGGVPNNQGVGNVGVGGGGGGFNNPAGNLNSGSVGGFGGANMNQLGNGGGGGGVGFGSGLNNMGNGTNSGGGGGGGGVNNSFQDGANNNNANNNLPNGHDPKNSTQVTIPKDLAGAIIGKGGGRIRRIRNDSGAYITIDEPLPGSTDRIITISGSPKQIQMAQYLLQQSVHESNGGRRNF